VGRAGPLPLLRLLLLRLGSRLRLEQVGLEQAALARRAGAGVRDRAQQRLPLLHRPRLALRQRRLQPPAYWAR
jgi:hypothetical protein